MLNLISSNLSDKSKNQNPFPVNNNEDKNDINNKSNQNKTLLLKNEFSYKEAKTNKVKDNRKVNYINYNLINRPRDPVTQKIIKSLKMNEKEVINELTKIMQNEKLLKNQSYLKLINNNPNNINLDKRKLEVELKQLNENKKGYMMRLDEIKIRIKSLEDKYEKQQGIFDNERQEKLNQFIDKQNRLINENNDELNIKIKKLQNENNKLLANMQNDMEKNIMKKMNEIEKIKKGEEKNKLILLKKIRDDERKEIMRRKNRISEETKKLNQYINKKPEIQKYLYQKINNTYQEKTNKRILKETNKRKLLMKPMDDDINTMIKNYQEYKNRRNLEMKENTQKLKKSWSERNLLIPTYKTQLRQLLDIEEHNMKIEKDNEIEKKKEMKNNQINYSKKIENQQIFIKKQINEKQKINDEDYILRNRINSKPPLIMNHLNSYSDLIREKIFLKQNNKSQDSIKLPNNKDFINKNNNLNSQVSNVSEKVNKSNITKLPNLNNNKIFNLKKNQMNKNVNKKIINKRNNSVINKNKKSETIQVENIDYKGTKEIQKLIEKNGFDKKTLELANSKLERLSEKQKQKSLLLKCEGGFINNPGLGEEVCDILIDSMTAKLSLLNEIDKMESNNKNKPQLVDKGIGPETGNINNLYENKNEYNNKSNIEENDQNEYSSFNKDNEDEYN